MTHEDLKTYLHRRLNEIDQGADMKELTLKGKLSFGIDSREYGHLPGWKELLNKKKLLTRMVWVNAISVSLIVVLMVGDVTDKFFKNWYIGLLYWFFLAAVIMLFNVIGSFYSIFYHFRQTEREIRRLLYQDILHRMEGTEPAQ